MKLKTFNGSSPSIALKKAQNEFGHEALVVSTKQIRKKSLVNDALYEVVIAYEEKKITVKPDNDTSNDAFLLDISNAAKEISKITNENKEIKKSFTPIQSKEIRTNTKDNDFAKKNEASELKSIKSDFKNMMDKVKTIQHMLWDEKAEHRNICIPPEFSEIYKISKFSGIDKNHLDAIMQLTLENMPTKMKQNSDSVRRYFQVLLRKMVPVRYENNLDNGKQKITMLVGPTGVGKTTTLAKLAARYSYLLNKKYKVGIITLDTYRIGAVEQLFQYAKMMKIPMEDVVDENDFENAIRSLSYCDIILIDTMGSSQYDNENLKKIEQFIKSTSYDIDINLVLSTVAKVEDMYDIYNNFSFLNLDTLIFTKIDETRHLGNIFSLVYKTKKPISYFSTGQEVPDDIIVASSDTCIDWILNGFEKTNKVKKIV